jgi:hypothetical protein
MPIYFIPNCKPIVFVHVPKTGGSSIEHCLSSIEGSMCIGFSQNAVPHLGCTPQHFTYESLNAIYGSLIADAHWFSIVRNPYSRLESEFFYRLNGGMLKLGSNPKEYFSEWVMQVLNEYCGDHHIFDNHLLPQTVMIGPIDDWYRYEDTLESALRSLAQMTGFSADGLQLLRKKSGYRSNVYWTPAAEKACREIYAADFERFGYGSVAPARSDARVLRTLRYSLGLRLRKSWCFG